MGATASSETAAKSGSSPLWLSRRPRAQLPAPRPCPRRLLCGGLPAGGPLGAGRLLRGGRAARSSPRFCGFARVTTKRPAGARRPALSLQRAADRARPLGRRLAPLLCGPAGGATGCALLARHLHSRTPSLAEPDGDRLLGRPRPVLPFAHVMDLLPHEFPGLRGPGTFPHARPRVPAPASYVPACCPPSLYGLPAGSTCAAWASSSRTSSSLVCEKSSYHMPTDRNGSGVAAQTTSSTSAPSAAQVSGGAMGTATMRRPGCCAWRAIAAAFMVAPVARPSSTRITVRPATSGDGRPSR